MSAASIAVIGSVAFDTLETPAGRADDVPYEQEAHQAPEASR